MLQGCSVIESIDCNITNANIEAFVGCVVAEEFSCTDFVSCSAAANSTQTVASVTPAPMMTAAPTDMTANQDISGVSRTVAAAATRTAMVFACGLALFLSV